MGGWVVIAPNPEHLRWGFKSGPDKSFCAAFGITSDIPVFQPRLQFCLSRPLPWPVAAVASLDPGVEFSLGVDGLGTVPSTEVVDVESPVENIGKIWCMLVPFCHSDDLQSLYPGSLATCASKHPSQSGGAQSRLSGHGGFIIRCSIS